MLRIVLILFLLTSAAAPAALAQTADQLNKLSLEALTAPPAHGSGGYVPTPHRRFTGPPHRRPPYRPPAYRPRPAYRPLPAYRPGRAGPYPRQPHHYGRR